MCAKKIFPQARSFDKRKEFARVNKILSSVKKILIENSNKSRQRRQDETVHKPNSELKLSTRLAHFSVGLDNIAV